MSESQFPILGAAVPAMLGRSAILQKMTDALTKEIPDHLQVVGPKFSGKSMVLNELATRLRIADSNYAAVLLWDLGHQTPGSDSLFMQGLARELSAALLVSHRDYADHLRSSEDNPYQDIAEVLDLLKAEGERVLVIMDGFDKPLSNGKLTRNLWDQLLDLARKPSLRLVTASRQTLYQLLRSPESQTSDFWGIFDTKIQIGCFDETDLAAILKLIPQWSLSAGAMTELWNATNGFPVFLLGVLKSVFEKCAQGSVSPGAMTAACDSAFLTLHDKIDALWIDCPPTCQDLFRRVLNEGSVKRTGISTTDADTLIHRGFVTTVAQKLERPNRLLAKYLKEHSNEGSSIVHLFANPEDYFLNMRGALERRVTHIDGLDKELQRYLLLGVGELPEFPKVFFSNIRGIIDRALNMIWDAELGSRNIPSGWISTWRYNGETRADDWLGKFPQGGQRLRLLDLMTSSQKGGPFAKYVTRTTYVLANAVQGFGDFGQHQEDAPIDPGTAYSGLHLCIELAAAVTRELPST